MADAAWYLAEGILLLLLLVVRPPAIHDASRWFVRHTFPVKTLKILLRGSVYVVGLALVVWLSVLVFPHRIASPSSPSVWQTAMDNPWFLEAIRVTLIVAGIYVILSVAALIHHGKWLTKFGPLAVGKQVQEARGSATAMEAALARANAENARLTTTLAANETLLAQVRARVATGQVQFLWRQWHD